MKTTTTSAHGVYGYRFSDSLQTSLHQLFAIGYERVTSPSYRWDGLERVDGPLLLFQYTVSGCGIVELGDQAHSVPEGTAFLVEIPGDHRYYLPADSSGWEFYFILMRPAQLDGHWQELIRLMGRVPTIPGDSAAIRYLQDAYHTASRNRIRDGFMASSIVYRFVMELFRHATALHKEKDAWPAVIQQTVRAIESNAYEWQSLDEIAAGSGLSKYHLVRLFRKHTGYTPIQYVTKVRVQASVELLRQTSLSIDEIARRLGYSSGSYFIRVFRQYMGYSPGAFREGRGIAQLQHIQFDE